MHLRFISGLLLAATTASGAATERADSQPNIVVVLADDLGWSDIGMHGGEIPTPHIDRLAREGVRFAQFYNNSVCGPSRASLLTGLYAQRVGHSGRRWNDATDYSRAISLGEALQAAGYHTLMVGKWQDPELPRSRGFDRFFGAHTQAIISYFDEVKGNPFYLDDERVPYPPGAYLTDTLTQYALHFLGQHAAGARSDRKPFFLYLAHIAPHWPLHAPERDVAPHREKYLALGWQRTAQQRRQRLVENRLIPAEWRPAPRSFPAWETEAHQEWQAERMAVYAAQVSALDRSVGEIVAWLKREGELDRTLIVFLSDNGADRDGGQNPHTRDFGFAKNSAQLSDWRLDGGRMRSGSGPDVMPGPRDTFAAAGPAWAAVSNSPFRDDKLSGYEGGVRTPCIVRWPLGRLAAAGSVVQQVGHLIDLMPTLVSAARGNFPTHFRGRSLLPLDGVDLLPALKGAEPTARTLAWQAPFHRALLDGRWKIVQPDSGGAWELYDLSADGCETRNLAVNHPEIVQRLSAQWEAWHVANETN